MFVRILRCVLFLHTPPLSLFHSCTDWLGNGRAVLCCLLIFILRCMFFQVHSHTALRIPLVTSMWWKMLGPQTERPQRAPFKSLSRLLQVGGHWRTRGLQYFTHLMFQTLSTRTDTKRYKNKGSWESVAGKKKLRCGGLGRATGREPGPACVAGSWGDSSASPAGRCSGSCWSFWGVCGRRVGTVMSRLWEFLQMRGGKLVLRSKEPQICVALLSAGVELIVSLGCRRTERIIRHQLVTVGVQSGFVSLMLKWGDGTGSEKSPLLSCMKSLVCYNNPDWNLRKRCLKYSKQGRRLSRSTPSDGIHRCHVNGAITVLPPSGCHQFFLYTGWKINPKYSVLDSICWGNKVPCWRESLFQTVSLDTRSSSGFAGYYFVLHATTLSLTNVLLSSVLAQPLSWRL